MKHEATDRELMEIFDSFAKNVVEIGVAPKLLASLLDFWTKKVAEDAAGPDRPDWTPKNRLLIEQFRKFQVKPTGVAQA